MAVEERFAIGTREVEIGLANIRAKANRESDRRGGIGKSFTVEKLISNLSLWAIGGYAVSWDVG